VRTIFVRALIAALVLTVVPPVAAVTVVAIPEVVSTQIDIPVSADQVSLTRSGARDAATYRSAPIAASMPFSMIGFRLPEGVDAVKVRTAGSDGVWSEWIELDAYDAQDDGPDPGTAEAAGDRSHEHTEPLFVGEATRLQVEAPVDLEGDASFRATLIDTDGLSGGPVTRQVVRSGPIAEASTRAPAFVSRAAWGAVPPSSKISYASKVDLTVVHHTAGSNSYTQSQAPGIVRGIQRYHMQSNGWSDIGYNALVDRFGTIYEGRAGGLEWAVVGAHARNYNSGSFGVAAMGNFEGVQPPQAVYDAFVRIISWKSSIHHMDPLGTTTRTYNGNLVRTISGHRDVGSTACPGLIRNNMWWIRTEAGKATSWTTGEPTGRPPSPEPAPEPAPEPKPEPSPSPTAAPASELFPDVSPDNFHRGNVETVHDRRVLLGYLDHNKICNGAASCFRPEAALNRGDMARAVATAMGLEPAKWDDRFSDVPSWHWLAPWIIALNDAGVVHGYGDGRFGISDPLRRDQMATFLARSMDLPRSEPSFGDIAADNPHRRAIGAVEKHGITTGISETRYGPSLSMRRDQSATLLVRAYGIGPRG
jgi:hypothetical protein